MENLEQYRIIILHEDLKTCNSVIDEIRNIWSDNKQMSVLSELRYWMKERHNIINTLLKLRDTPPDTNDNYSNSCNEIGDGTCKEIQDVTNDERNNRITDSNQIFLKFNNQNATNKSNRYAQIIIKETGASIKCPYQKNSFSLDSNQLARPPTIFID